jgi:hypothetical protein
LFGVGPGTAAVLLIAAGDHPGRLRSEAAWAHLGAAAPIPASFRQGHPAPAQPRRRPAGQPRPVADRPDPDGLAPADARLRRPAQQRRLVQTRDHPLPGSTTPPAKPTATCGLTDPQPPGAA